MITYKIKMFSMNQTKMTDTTGHWLTLGISKHCMNNQKNDTSRGEPLVCNPTGCTWHACSCFLFYFQVLEQQLQLHQVLVVRALLYSQLVPCLELHLQQHLPLVQQWNHLSSWTSPLHQRKKDDSTSCGHWYCFYILYFAKIET